MSCSVRQYRSDYSPMKTTHFVNVDGGSVLLVSEEMIVSHTDFTKVTRMVL